MAEDELENQFAAAAEYARKDMPSSISNNIKGKIYGLYKQSTEGPCTGKRPGILQVAARLKFDAWVALEDMSSEQAKKEYVALIESLKIK